MTLKTFLFVLICLLIFSQPLSAGEATADIDSHYFSLGITSLSDAGQNGFQSVAGIKVQLSLYRWATGVEAAYQANGIQRTAFYIQHRLSEPLGDDIWTFFQMGLVNLQYIDTFESYSGLLLGTTLVRFFNQNWSAHTNIHLTYLPEILVPSFETGFKYYFSPRWSLDFSFRGFDLERYGFTVGTSLYR